MRSFPQAPQRRLKRPWQRLIAVFGAGLVCTPVLAQVSVSGFGTLGYAQSDRSFRYQRFVDDDGTFNRDTLIGAQADIRLGEQFSLVAQAKLAPSLKRNNPWDTTLTWAFLAWRPTNDLLLRAGRFRLPYYLNSANLDVGVTYDPAQLPQELYSISPTNETTGISLSHTWETAPVDIALDAYWGSANFFGSIFFRDDYRAFGGPDRGRTFIPLEIDSRGFALTFTRSEDILRLGFHHAGVMRRDGGEWTKDFPLINLPDGQSFYLASQSPLVPTVREIRFSILTAGFDIGIGRNLRLAGEFARRTNVNAPRGGADTRGGYLALRYDAGSWHPYVSIARLLSNDPSLGLFEAVNSNRVVPSPFLPAPASLINASQRFAADRLVVYDQSTLAIGTSYILSPTQKLKFEWATTHVGKVSSFVDAPEGGNVRDQNIHVLSASYNFTF